MGFEPMCPKPDNCISSAARYDHFDTSPKHSIILYTINEKLQIKIYRKKIIVDFFLSGMYNVLKRRHYVQSRLA